MTAETIAQAPTVTTWADGFGTWHARVTFPTCVADVAHARQLARHAIREQVVQRGEAPTLGWLPVVTMTNPADAMPRFLGGPGPAAHGANVIDWKEV